jgi:hypothetical protein
MTDNGSCSRDAAPRACATAEEFAASVERMRIADRFASIGTLVAGLGHDMNNVLLPVHAHLNALAKELDACGAGAPARRSLEMVRQSVSYLQQLADGLHELTVETDAPANDDAPATDLQIGRAHV